MKTLRLLFALSAASLAGILFPVLATVYDHWARHQRNAQLTHDLWWTHFILDAVFVAEGSLVVGLATGGLGVWYLYARGFTSLLRYALTGGGIGAVCGVLFTWFMHHSGDTLVAALILITLPAISMTLGFSTYWLIQVRNRASRPIPPANESVISVQLPN